VIKKRVRARPRLAAGIASALVVATVLVVTTLAEGSVQQVVPATAAPDRFSAQRALAELERFATEPRPLGSPASDDARRYLVDGLRGAGLQVEIQHSVGVRSAAGLATFGRVDNIVATLPGRNPTGTVVLAAHYDSASMGPGASDDGASVAALLETVRALRGDAQLRNDLVVLITDGEEDGSIGAEAFIREHPLARHGGVVLNWEARGVDGPSLMFETSPGNAGIVGLFTASVPHPRGDSSLGAFYRALPNSSDFSTLRRAGFVGMNFAFVEGAARYHTASDSIVNLEPGSVQHHGETMLALARAFGDTDIPALGADHDLVHFRLMGAEVSYSDALVRPLAVLAVLLLAGVVVLARARPGYDMMGGLLHRPLAYELAIGAISVFALGAWYLALRRRLGAVALAIGALTWPTALGLACAVFAPGAAFVFTLPSLACVLGGLLALLWPRWSPAALTAGAAVSAMVLPAEARVAFDGVGLAFGGAGALLIVLFGMTLLPIAEMFLPRGGVDRRAAVGLPAVAALLAVALVGTGLVVDRPDGAHAQRSHLAYVLDADAGTAHWVSAEAVPTGWTGRYVSTRDTAALPAGYARGELWTGQAEPLLAEGPDVTGSRTSDTLRLHVSSRRGATGMTLRIERPISEVTARSPGSAPVTVPVTGVRAGTWPGEIRFRDLPTQGVDIEVRLPPGPVRVTAIDETHGLEDAPGFVARPPDVEAGTREDGDLVAVTRTVAL
jgi:hypothetical protein